MGDQNGGDCSDHKCPYEISWISAPDTNGFVHGCAVCAGRGICDRSSSQCECFGGFTGKACAYTTCPNDCSGHGTCEYIEELTIASTPGDYYNDVSEGFHTTGVALDYVSTLWDAGKSRACLCDPMYTEVDCSRKMCSKGNDVLDTRSDTTDTSLSAFALSGSTSTRGGPSSSSSLLPEGAPPAPKGAPPAPATGGSAIPHQVALYYLLLGFGGPSSHSN